MPWQVARSEPTRTTLVRRLRAGALVLAATLAPIAVTAQQPAAARPTTHTVKRGDTLWDLAKRYLGDSYLWPRIYRLNTSLIRDPHWIYPGEILTLPGPEAAVPTIAKAPAPKDTTAPVDTTARADTTARVDTAAAVAAAPEPQPPEDMSGPTVFMQRQRSEAEESAAQVPLVEPPPVVRLGEFIAAPFVERTAIRRSFGKILGSAELEGISSAAEPSRYQDYSDVYVTPPAGATAAVGDRYVAVSTGPDLEGLGRVIIPTGVVRVTRAPLPGQAAVAQVVQVFGSMKPGQQLMPYDSSVLSLTGSPAPVQNGRTAKVQWISRQPVLPGIQSYLVLDLSARDGVKIGDRFELYRKVQKPTESGAPALPEIQIGTASVVRVTSYATTVVVTSVEQPKIEPGTSVRVTAQMP